MIILGRRKCENVRKISKKVTLAAEEQNEHEISECGRGKPHQRDFDPQPHKRNEVSSWKSQGSAHCGVT